MRMHKASVQLVVEVESSSREAAEYLANRVIEATKKISITKHFSEGHGTAAVKSGHVLMLRALPVAAKQEGEGVAVRGAAR